MGNFTSHAKLKARILESKINTRNLCSETGFLSVFAPNIEICSHDDRPPTLMLFLTASIFVLREI